MMQIIKRRLAVAALGCFAAGILGMAGAARAQDGDITATPTIGTLS